MIGKSDRAVATTDSVSPIGIFADGTAIVTTIPESVGVVTVRASAPICPSLVASMIAEPSLMAVTKPVDDTVAIVGALVAHATERFGTLSPAASVDVIVSCNV